MPLKYKITELRNVTMMETISQTGFCSYDHEFSSRCHNRSLNRVFKSFVEFWCRALNSICRLPDDCSRLVPFNFLTALSWFKVVHAKIFDWSLLKDGSKIYQLTQIDPGEGFESSLLTGQKQNVQKGSNWSDVIEMKLFACPGPS